MFEHRAAHSWSQRQQQANTVKASPQYLRPKHTGRRKVRAEDVGAKMSTPKHLSQVPHKTAQTMPTQPRKILRWTSPQWSA